MMNDPQVGSQARSREAKLPIEDSIDSAPILGRVIPNQNSGSRPRLPVIPPLLVSQKGPAEYIESAKAHLPQHSDSAPLPIESILVPNFSRYAILLLASLVVMFGIANLAVLFGTRDSGTQVFDTIVALNSGSAGDQLETYADRSDFPQLETADANVVTQQVSFESVAQSVSDRAMPVESVLQPMAPAIAGPKANNQSFFDWKILGNLAANTMKAATPNIVSKTSSDVADGGPSSPWAKNAPEALELNPAPVVGTYGTGILWEASLDEALATASDTGKMVFLIQVSGNFACEEFT